MIESRIHKSYKMNTSSTSLDKIGNYLNYDKLKSLHDPSGPHKCPCYSNLMFYVCPNPYNPSKADVLQKRYEQGSYVTKETINLSDANFRNKENWNS